MFKTTFNSWLKYCFDKSANKDTSESPYYLPNAILLAEYLEKLFSNPCILNKSYTDSQIDEGLWFICGVNSEYFCTASKLEVPNNLKYRWVKSILYLYSELFETQCANYYSHLGRGPEQKKAINEACYMLWDMSSLENVIQKNEQLLDIGFEILNKVVFLKNIACVESALHGLGHLSDYPKSQLIIESYLCKGQIITPELEEYALCAIEGNIL